MTLVICFLIYVTAVSAQLVNGKESVTAPAPVTVIAPTTIKLVGSNFDIPITVSDTTGEGIFGYQFDLRFDPNVIQLQPVYYNTAGTISSGMSITVNQPTPGRLLLVAFIADPPLSGAGTLINLKFTAVGANGQVSPLTWFDFFFNEETPQDIDVNGQVTLALPTAAGASVSGMVMSAEGRAVRNAGVSMTNTHGVTRNALSNNFGYYRFMDVPVGMNYIVSVRSKQYTFSTQIVFVGDEITNLNLIGEP